MYNVPAREEESIFASKATCYIAKQLLAVQSDTKRLFARSTHGPRVILCTYVLPANNFSQFDTSTYVKVPSPNSKSIISIVLLSLRETCSTVLLLNSQCLKFCTNVYDPVQTFQASQGKYDGQRANSEKGI